MGGSTAPAVEDRSIGVPDGVVARAAALLTGTGGLHQHISPQIESGPQHRAVALLTAPRQLEPRWPEPSEPIPVADGWVHASVIDEDRPVLDELLRSRDWTAEALAETAQHMRLPVTPYRSAPRPVRPRSAHHSPGPGQPTDTTDTTNTTVTTGAVIIDLSTHWAGPLATSLLAARGATVVKVDPDCRPDGFRAKPRLYPHLNGGKRILDLDLRSPVDRRRFEALVSEADLVVESFSRRVMANLGYQPEALRRLNPTVCSLGIRAFPADGPERDWLAYGPGVHAASGLGFRDGRPWPAMVAYPDPLAGLEAFRMALRLLAEPDRPAEAEVSLLGSIEALPEPEQQDGARPGITGARGEPGREGR